MKNPVAVSHNVGMIIKLPSNELKIYFRKFVLVI